MFYNGCVGSKQAAVLPLLGDIQSRYMDGLEVVLWV